MTTTQVNFISDTSTKAPGPGRISLKGGIPANFLRTFFITYIEAEAEEAWFWTEYWQDKEREVEQEIALDRTMRFQSVDELIEYLDRNR